MSDEFQRYLQPSSTDGAARSGMLIARLLTATSILVAIFSLLGTKELPLWLIIIFGAFVVVVTLVVTFPLVKTSFGTFKARLRTYRGARALLPRVHRDAQRLQRQLSATSTSTFLHELRDMQNCRSTTGDPLFYDLYATPQHISEWLHILGVVRAKSTQSILLYFSATNLAMTQYSQFCKTLENRLQSYVRQDQVAPDTALKIKPAWNHGRESQVRLLQDWANTSHEINRAIGRDICHAFHEPVRVWL